MEPTNLFCTPTWYVLIWYIFSYTAIICTILYRMFVKGEMFRSLKKLLMGFSLMLLLGICEMLLYLNSSGQELLGNLSIMAVKFFCCSSFFLYVFYQSAGFVPDSFLHCALLQLAMVSLLGSADLLYCMGVVEEGGYMLILAIIVQLAVFSFLVKFSRVCCRRFETIMQILEKDNIAQVCIMASLILGVSYFVMINLFVSDCIILGILVLLVIFAIHIFLLYRWHFYRAGRKNYKFTKGEHIEEDMLMELQPMDDYKIVQRLILYFETKKPYLDSDLKLADVSKHIYTNRTYLSRALNHRLSKNFNQFVNYYRVKEACRLFIEDPMLKVSDLRVRCGFKNISSFSNAFSFNLRYTPAEWCKEVRRRIKNNEDVSIKDYFS